jgi:hypothetical protein
MRTLGRTRAIALMGILALLAGAGCNEEAKNPNDSDWSLVFQDLEGALISVDGTSANDVWIAGADTRDGKGATVLHFDGKRWKRLATGIKADFWWVRVFSAKSIYFGGAKGTIAHYDGKKFTRMDTPADSATVYGIWGATEDEIWAVGGDPDVAPNFVWRWDGEKWNDLTDDLPQGSDGPALFKVWGQADDDVWIVGYEGTTVRWDGKKFSTGKSGTEQPLFTVHGARSGAPEFVAVGGDSSATILEYNGTTWHKAAVDSELPPVIGVYVRNSYQAYAVGYEGIVLHREDAAWKLLDTGVEIFNPFHTVWVDPDDGVWAVGGDVLSPTPSEGMLLHRGSAIPHDISEE